MAAADAQVRTILEVHHALDVARVRCWLFGGWGMDAHIGRVTREHGDIEFWVERKDAAPALECLTARGFVLLATQPTEESFEFEREGLRFSTAFFDRRGDSYSQPAGRWADWRFPPGSFGDDVGVLGGQAVRVMSLQGLLAMKRQYPTLRNGRPWRPKDIADIAALEALLASQPGR